MAMFQWLPTINGAAAVVPSYLNALGFDRHPFPVAPDDAHFYTSAYIEQVVAEIVHGIDARKGFMVISGDVGLGKTTITRRILQILEEKRVNTSLVFHTSLKDVDLLREINRDFGIVEQDAGTGPPTLGEELKRLNTFLTAQYRQGRNCAIIIDDAQNLDRSSLELVRMISNLEADCQKVVQILLVGQPELMTHLGMPELRQLRSRIFLNKVVRPLNLDELRTYTVFKLSQAGNQGRINVTRKAFHYLHRRTAGNFRHVNMLMDRCLYQLCSDGGHRIEARHVRMAQADMQHEPKGMRLRIPTRALSAVLPLLLLMVIWGLHFYLSRGAVAAPAFFRPQAVEAKAPAPAEVAAINADISDQAGPEGVDPAVVAFLRSIQLEAHATEFERARMQGNLKAWGEEIFRHQGLQLVQLHTLTDQIRRRYGALALPTPEGGGVDWLLFWRPTLAVPKFYYGYQGREVEHLQRLLAAAGEYTKEIDGRVGPHLMKALVAFQTRSGLTVNGLPDAPTVFSLCQQEGHS